MNENDIWLIAGLGNPEAKYDGTRHNAGFAALDALADKWNISVGKTKFQGLWGQGEVDGHKVVLLRRCPAPRERRAAQRPRCRQRRAEPGF